MPRRRRDLLLAAVLGPLVVTARAQAAPSEVSAMWPQVRLVGRGRLRFVGMHIYDARLWAPAPLSADDWARQGFALELGYARTLEGRLIAERALDEMRRQGAFDSATAERWLAQMKATFPDVRAGDRLTGVHRPAEPARFFVNGVFKAEWPDADLVRQFFGIWLATQTSEPALREALLGGRA